MVWAVVGTGHRSAAAGGDTGRPGERGLPRHGRGARQGARAARRASGHPAGRGTRVTAPRRVDTPGHGVLRGRAAGLRAAAGLVADLRVQPSGAARAGRGSSVRRGRGLWRPGPRVGQPGAAQAVGVAMGSNPLPVVVPAPHSVVESDGGIGGFGLRRPSGSCWRWRDCRSRCSDGGAGGRRRSSPRHPLFMWARAGNCAGDPSRFQRVRVFAVTSVERQLAVPADAEEIAALRRRITAVLIAGQILGGLGVATGIALATVLAKQVSGTESLSGLAPTATVTGTAVLSVPLAALITAALPGPWRRPTSSGRRERASSWSPRVWGAFRCCCSAWRGSARPRRRTSRRGSRPPIWPSRSGVPGSSQRGVGDHDRSGAGAQHRRARRTERLRASGYPRPGCSSGRPWVFLLSALLVAVAAAARSRRPPGRWHPSRSSRLRRVPSAPVSPRNCCLGACQAGARDRGRRTPRWSRSCR